MKTKPQNKRKENLGVSCVDRGRYLQMCWPKTEAQLSELLRIHPPPVEIRFHRCLRRMFD